MPTTLTRNTDILRVEVAAHIEADALVRGQYWEGGDTAETGKGCFIGCLTHSDDPAPAFERFGLPDPVLRIAENIFEALPDDAGRAFFAALPGAVACDGKDLSLVHWAFLAAELRALPPQEGGVRAAIDTVIDGMDRLMRGEEWGKEEARAARASASADAADAAAYAAYAAADAAAAYAADAADVADVADAAAYAAADAAVRIRQRDTLLRLISEAPVAA